MQKKMRSYCQLAKSVRELVEKWQVEMAAMEVDAGANVTHVFETKTTYVLRVEEALQRVVGDFFSNKVEPTSTTGGDVAMSEKEARVESPRPSTSHIASVFSPEPSSSATPNTANGYMSRHELKSCE